MYVILNPGETVTVAFSGCDGEFVFHMRKRNVSVMSTWSGKPEYILDAKIRASEDPFPTIALE